MKQVMKLGVTDRTVTVLVPDPASTDGSGKTGLNAAALTVSYTRVETDNDVTVTDVTSSLNDLSALTDAHNDWGLKEVSSTLAPGLYRLDIADAAFAAGAWSVVVYVMITSSAAAASPMEFILESATLSDVPTANQVADAVLTRDWTATVAAIGTIPARCALRALRFLRNKWAPSGGVIQVFEEDDTTVSHSLTPTSDPAAEPITSLTP